MIQVMLSSYKSNFFPNFVFMPIFPDNPTAYFTDKTSAIWEFENIVNLKTQCNMKSGYKSRF